MKRTILAATAKYVRTAPKESAKIPRFFLKTRPLPAVHFLLGTPSGACVLGSLDAFTIQRDWPSCPQKSCF